MELVSKTHVPHSKVEVRRLKVPKKGGKAAEKAFQQGEKFAKTQKGKRQRLNMEDLT